MNAKQTNYLRGWVAALAAAVESKSMQDHLAASLLGNIGTEREIARHADSGDVAILCEHGVMDSANVSRQESLADPDQPKTN